MINYVVKNTRGVVVRTFDTADRALAWAKAHSAPEALGALQAWEQETVVRERLLGAEEPKAKRLRVVAR